MVVSTVHERIRECLSDVGFPASKDQLVDAAIGNDCPDLAGMLRAIPDQMYANRAEVMASVMLAKEQPAARRAV